MVNHLVWEWNYHEIAIRQINKRIPPINKLDFMVQILIRQVTEVSELYNLFNHFNISWILFCFFGRSNNRKKTKTKTKTKTKEKTIFFLNILSCVRSYHRLEALLLAHFYQFLLHSLIMEIDRSPIKDETRRQHRIIVTQNLKQRRCSSVW